MWKFCQDFPALIPFFSNFVAVYPKNRPHLYSTQENTVKSKAHVSGQERLLSRGTDILLTSKLI